MIRRPPKRIGGTIGQEIDALWGALARVQVQSTPGVAVDQTTRGTVVRPRSDTRAVEEAAPCGAFFKITNAGPGHIFGASVREADGTEPPIVVSGTCGTGNKMLSPYNRILPNGLDRTPVFDAEEYDLLWELPTTTAAGYSGQWPAIGSIVFAVKTSFDDCLTGYTTDWEPIRGAKIAWRVISEAPQFTPPPPPGSVAISYAGPIGQEFKLGQTAFLSASIDTTMTSGAAGPVHFIAKGGKNATGGRIISVGPWDVITDFQEDMEYGVDVIAYNPDGVTIGDTDSIGFEVLVPDVAPIVTSASVDINPVNEGSWTNLTIGVSGGFPDTMEITMPDGVSFYSGAVNYGGSGSITEQLRRLSYIGANGEWTIKLANSYGESTGTVFISIIPYGDGVP